MLTSQPQCGSAATTCAHFLRSWKPSGRPCPRWSSTPRNSLSPCDRSTNGAGYTPSTTTPSTTAADKSYARSPRAAFKRQSGTALSLAANLPHWVDGCVRRPCRRSYSMKGEQGGGSCTRHLRDQGTSSFSFIEYRPPLAVTCVTDLVGAPCCMGEAGARRQVP